MAGAAAAGLAGVQKRGCWLAAGATAFFVVVVPITLTVLSIVMGASLLSIMESLGG